MSANIVYGLLLLACCVFAMPTVTWIACDTLQKSGLKDTPCYPVMGLSGLAVGALGVLCIFGVVGGGGGGGGFGY